MARPALRLAFPPLLLAAFALATTPASAGDAPPTTLQVHTEGEPAARHNDPVVGCPFLLEGFGIATPTGRYAIRAWIPTGDKAVVAEGDWTADSSDGDESSGHVHSHHFTVGPLTLPSGHYKAFVSNALEGTKTKAFWVDCEGTPPPPCSGDLRLSGHHYVLDGEAYPALGAMPLREGDEATVVFALEGCGELELGFAAYAATEGFALEEQVLSDRDGGTFVAGLHTLDVVVPPCLFQVDFFLGPAIEQFDPPEVTYSADGRLVDSVQGGESCQPPTTTTGGTGIPVFPSSAALAVGSTVAVAGSLLLLRRRP